MDLVDKLFASVENNLKPTDFLPDSIISLAFVDKVTIIPCTKINNLHIGTKIIVPYGMRYIIAYIDAPPSQDFFPKEKTHLHIIPADNGYLNCDDIHNELSCIAYSEKNIQIMGLELGSIKQVSTVRELIYDN